MKDLIKSTVIANNELKENLTKRLLSDILGTGIINDLLEDIRITEIFVNRWDTIFVKRNGKVEHIKYKFLSERHLLNIIGKILSKAGRRVDSSVPIVNTRLDSGDIIFVVGQPIAVNGASFTIKKRNNTISSIDQLIKLGTLNNLVAEFLSLSVKASLNLLIAGSPSTGKTSLLNCLSNMTSSDERIITIEDMAELSVFANNSISLECRPPNIDGRGEITTKHLLLTAQNMAPDRLIVGDCNHSEIYELLSSAQRGFNILTTMVAGSPEESISTIQRLMKIAANDIPNEVINEMILSNIDIIIQLKSLNKKKIILSISEPVAIKEGKISVEKIFVNDLNIYNDIIYTGYNSKCMEKIQKQGINIDEKIFKLKKG